MNYKRIFSAATLNRGYIILIITAAICYILTININNGKIITLYSSSGQAQQTNPAETPGRPVPVVEPAPVKQGNVNPSVNAVTEAAVKMGVLSCVSRINQVAGFLTANNKSGVFIFKPQNPPDQHLFSTSFELIRNDDSTLYASASFFPNKDAVYDTVEYVNKSCEEVEKTVFANLKRVSVMKKNIIVLDGGTIKVFLMPAGSGTIVIKKEVVQ